MSNEGAKNVRHSTFIGVPVLIRKIPNAEQTNKTSLFQFALGGGTKKAAVKEGREFGGGVERERRRYYYKKREFRKLVRNARACLISKPA
jgi:hypothetical protein